MLPQFTSSPICTGGRVCGPCRQREAGRPLRASFATAYQLPEGAPDFECPHGKPWAVGLGDVVAAIAGAVGITTVAKCVERLTGKPCGCQGRRAALNRAVPRMPAV